MIGADGKIHVLDMGSTAKSAEDQKKLNDLAHDVVNEIMAPQPPKKRAKPVDFFPSKIDRIAKMPRYPGVWG